MYKKTAFLVLILLSSSCLDNAEAAESVNHYIALDKKQSYSRQEMASMVAGLGGQLRHTLSPHEFMVYLPQKEGYSLTALPAAARTNPIRPLHCPLSELTNYLPYG